jgi:hypothetical protein
VYAYWQHLNECTWCQDADQLKLAQLVLQKLEGITTEIIPIRDESRISTIAFALKEVIDWYALQISEVAMDSICE